MTKVLQYPKGSIIQFTKGEYSDFCTCGLLVAIQNLDLPKLAQKMTAGKEQFEDAEPENFSSWLIANGYAMPVDANEVHLGSYGGWEPEFNVVYDVPDFDKIAYLENKSQFKSEEMGVDLESLCPR